MKTEGALKAEFWKAVDKFFEKMNWQNLRVCELFRQSREKRAPSPPDSPHSLYNSSAKTWLALKTPPAAKANM